MLIVSHSSSFSRQSLYIKEPTAVEGIFLVRAANMKDGQIARIFEYAKDISLNLQDFQFWVSVDVTNNESRADNLVSNGEELQNVHLHKYNLSMIEKRFSGSLDYSFREGYNTLRTSHIEAIVLFLEQSGLNSQDWKTIWIMEEDVAFSGNISDLLRFYRDKPLYHDADLISEEFSTMNESWSGWLFRSKAYRKTFNGMPIYFSKEHMQRFSRRFMNTLIDLLEKNVSAQSEQFTPTACINLNFSCVEFDRRHISLDTYSSKSRISRSTWENKVLPDPTQRNHLYHALKF